GFYEESRQSILRAFELGHEGDGFMHLRLARAILRLHGNCGLDVHRDLESALSSFKEALSFEELSDNAVHYLEVTRDLVQGYRTFGWQMNAQFVQGLTR
ncbi:unnamed protein product, partial [Choristocarpus tenellus]